VAAAQAAGCYKVILDCSDDNVDFYAKAGFQRKEVHMVRPLKAIALCRLVLPGSETLTMCATYACRLNTSRSSCRRA